MKGQKYDSEKPRWSLMPFKQLTDVVKALTAGAEKYDDYNWQKVGNGKDRYFSAAMRHFAAWRSGEKLDPETGLPHLAHAVCNLLFLMWFGDERKKLNLDQILVASLNSPLLKTEKPEKGEKP